MADKKEAECCGRTLAHKKDGRPYEHACTRKDVRPEDPFHVPGKQRPDTRTCACGEISTMGPFPGRHEADACGDHVRLISTDGEDLTEAYSPQEPFIDEPAGDHRKWCTRCKLLGHYAADCTTAVLDGGVVSVPEPAPATHSGQYLDDDPPLTGPLVDKAREVTEPDPFSTPTVPAPEVNVSGQPAARYEWRGKQNYGYLVKLPETGDFRRYGNGKPKGLTRATTFNKAASDSNALSEWGKRNVLIGASLRPDLVAKAHGLTHENGKDELMKLVAEMETAAGAKVSADIGTLIHELTERWDAGTITIDDVPQAYKELIRLYQDKLNQYGLRPVPGLIERTTYIPEFGGVVGTLDRVYYHERSLQYVIGDVKTGKTLKYGMDEIETQEWIYAHGVNNAGVYDWNTDEWDQPHTMEDVNVRLEVSEDWGVVIHMPVQGDDAGTVQLKRANLQRGRRHAEVCHDVRVQRANRPKVEAWTGEELAAPQKAARGWDDVFSGIDSREEAAIVWQKAYDAGIPPEEMERLKDLADARLAELAAPAKLFKMIPRDEASRAAYWTDRFSTVETVKDAGLLWEAARITEVEPMELQRLVGLAQQRLRELGITG